MRNNLIMTVSFDHISIGKVYSRNQLAKLWGYKGTEAISRGVVTPQNTNNIILFVTKEKKKSATQYRDLIENNELSWEGPNDHFAEKRMLNSEKSGDKIHLFYRERYDLDFTYYGTLILLKSQLYSEQPSRFAFKIYNSE